MLYESSLRDFIDNIQRLMQNYHRRTAKRQKASMVVDLSRKNARRSMKVSIELDGILQDSTAKRDKLNYSQRSEDVGADGNKQTNRKQSQTLKITIGTDREIVRNIKNVRIDLVEEVNQSRLSQVTDHNVVEDFKQTKNKTDIGSELWKDVITTPKKTCFDLIQERIKSSKSKIRKKIFGNIPIKKGSLDSIEIRQQNENLLLCLSSQVSPQSIFRNSSVPNTIVRKIFADQKQNKQELEADEDVQFFPMLEKKILDTSLSQHPILEQSKKSFLSLSRNPTKRRIFGIQPNPRLRNPTTKTSNKLLQNSYFNLQAQILPTQSNLQTSKANHFLDNSLQLPCLNVFTRKKAQLLNIRL